MTRAACDHAVAFTSRGLRAAEEEYTEYNIIFQFQAGASGAEVGSVGRV